MFAIGLVLFAIGAFVLQLRRDKPNHLAEVPFVLAFFIGMVMMLLSIASLAWRFLP